MENEYMDYLAHFGIRGQKWGVRRQMKKDPTYKAGYKAGKKHERRKRRVKKLLKTAAVVGVTMAVVKNRKAGSKS